MTNFSPINVQDLLSTGQDVIGTRVSVKRNSGAIEIGTVTAVDSQFMDKGQGYLSPSGYFAVTVAKEVSGQVHFYPATRLRTASDDMVDVPVAKAVEVDPESVVDLSADEDAEV